MPPTLFFSYSHADETFRNQLETHLSSLKRQEFIATWHDRRITAGSHVGNTIDANLNAAAVILLLISPDFISSDYCYERELARAMERHETGEARVIPVILRPCDWHSLPFGKLLAAPKDGKPISRWPDLDEAYLDVVLQIKAALKEMGKANPPSNPSVAPKPVGAAWVSAVTDALSGPRSSNLRVKKEFTDLDRDRFRQEGFEFIARFFENSMQELVKRNPDMALEQRFQRVDTNHFTAAVYKSGRKVCKGSVSMGNGAMGRNSISYAMNDAPSDGTMNEAVTVKNDDQNLYFEAFGLQSFGGPDKKKRLAAEGAAELFWEIFIRPLQQ